MNIQDEAMAAVTRTWVELTFKSPDARWVGERYLCQDPTDPPSTAVFAIDTAGKWIRGIGGTGNQGTVVDLIAKRDKLTLEQAAAKILGRELQGIKATRKVGKIKAVAPAPTESLKALSSLVRGESAKATHGTALRGYTYRRADGGISFCVTPYVTEASEVLQVPYFWGEDEAWHEGYPTDTGRPLYHLEVLAQAPRELPVMLVATERDASVEVPGYIVVSWSGGQADIKKTDWTPLDGRPVTVWAPAKTAATLKNRLGDAVVLDIQDRPADWGLADAQNAGIEILAFIETCPKIGGDAKAKGRPDDGFPFLCLGYDKASYYFLPRRTRVVHQITMGSFRNSQMLELAELSWWGNQGMITDQGSLKQAPAQELLITAQHQVGFFDPKTLRGAGVWRDAGGVVLNDGRRIVTMDRRSLRYDDYPSSFVYVPSQVGFGEMHGDQSTDADGARLEALFFAQVFEEKSMAVLMMGWCLLACFGGILKWRPHGWLTGRKGTGKSWVWEHIIEPIVGDFAHKGSAKDSEAGVRWSLDQDARPALFAEMEPKTDSARARISGILELARNASDDSSGRVNISQAGGGTKTFHLRSMFLFNSKNLPEEDAAIKSRILQFELKSGVDMARKIAESKRILDGGLMDDPGRFRRRIFHALPRIIADIEYIRQHYRDAFGEQRAVDQVAPLLAAAWAVQSTKPVSDSGVWIDNWIAELAVEGKRVEEDEDTFIRHLLGSVLKTDANKSRTVAELLIRAAGDIENPAGDQESEDLLERYGLGLKRTSRSTPWKLCIATNSAALAGLFARTPYASGYGAQVRRHPLAEDEQAKVGGTKGVHKVLAGQRVRCQLLDWDRFRAKYIDEEGQGLDLPPF